MSEREAWAVVVLGAIPVAQSWNEQYCIYTSAAAAKRSIREHGGPGEKVALVRITVSPAKARKAGGK